MEHRTVFKAHEIESLVREYGLESDVPKAASVTAQTDGSYLVVWQTEDDSAST